jgi:hypothetical protein
MAVGPCYIALETQLPAALLADVAIRAGRTNKTPFFVLRVQSLLC